MKQIMLNELMLKISKPPSGVIEEYDMVMTDLPRNPGIYRLKQPANDRRFALAIPQGISDDTPVPFVVGLHWGLDIYAYISADFLEGLVYPALVDSGAIILAPERQEDTWTNPRSEKYVIQLVDFISSNYNVDRSRVILMGYSMGGMGCWYIGRRHQDLFKAMVPMASVPPEKVDKGDFDIPIYIIHGRGDEFFPVEQTVSMVKSLMGEGEAVELYIVENATHFDVSSYVEPLKLAIPWVMEQMFGR